MRILIDMDDVLTTCVSVWIEYLNSKTGKHATPSDITDWEIKRFYPELTDEELFCPLEMEEFWEKVTPLKDSVSCVKQLQDCDNDIVVVSASYPTSYKYKIRVLNEFFPFIPMDHIVVAHDKSFINGDVLVDDKPENLINSNCRYGVLFTAPHNKSFVTDNKKIFRANTWEEAYKLICHM